MGYCTVKALGLTILALPSSPSAQTNQLPAVGGVAKYAPHRLVLTNVDAVQLVGGTVADCEQPNWTGAGAGDPSALTPIDPLPCVYVPKASTSQVTELTDCVAANVTAVTTEDANPAPD